MERLGDKPAHSNEITSFNPANNIEQCDFKKAYQQSGGDINRMKIRLYQYPPRPFNTSITADMSKHRIFGG